MVLGEILSSSSCSFSNAVDRGAPQSKSFPTIRLRWLISYSVFLLSRGSFKRIAKRDNETSCEQSSTICRYDLRTVAREITVARQLRHFLVRLQQTKYYRRNIILRTFLQREEEITRLEEQIKSNDLSMQMRRLRCVTRLLLSFYSSQMRRGRLDLTQFYEEKDSAQSHKGIP